MTKLNLFLDIAMITTVLIYFLYIPIHLTFEIFLDEILGYGASILLPIIYFIIDFLQLFTCYYDKGVLVKDRKKIIKRYFKN